MVKVNVCEMFLSIQGEGLTIGTPALFVRFFGCNLRCEWCDTAYAIDGYGVTEMEVDEVVTWIKDHMWKTVVVTGGEPFYQYEALRELVNSIIHHHIIIETNGTVFNESLARRAYIVLSPKLPSSGMVINDKVLREWYDYSVKNYSHIEWKFVIGNERDFNVFKHYYDILGLHRVNVSLQPVDNDKIVYQMVLGKLMTWERPPKLLCQIHKVMEVK